MFLKTLSWRQIGDLLNRVRKKRKKERKGTFQAELKHVQTETTVSQKSKHKVYEDHFTIRQACLSAPVCPTERDERKIKSSKLLGFIWRLEG